MTVIVCPICRRHIQQTPHRSVMAAHTDTIGKTCPMSGQPIGIPILDKP